MAKLNTKKLNIKNLFKSNKNANNKKRIRKTWIIIGAVATVISLGIGVPLGIVNNTTTQLAPADPNNSGVVFTNPNNNSSDVNIGQIISRSEQQDSKFETTFKNFNIAAYQLFYQEEFAMSQTITEAWSKSNLKVSVPFREFQKVESIEEITTKQAKVLEDEKNNTKSRFGFQNWNAEWTRILANDAKFGKAVTEEGALNFLVLNAIKENATRRFKVKLLNMFDVRHINATVTEEIKYLGDIPSLGIKTGDVYLKAGERIMQNFFNTDQAASGDKPEILANYVVESTSTAPEESKPTAIFATTSFLNFLPASFYGKYLNANEILKSNLDRYKSIYNVSSFVIPGTANATDIDGNWTLTKENLQTIMSFGLVNEKVMSLLDDDAIFKFKGTTILNESEVSEDTKKAITADNFWLSTRSSNANKNNHGLLAFGSLDNIFNTINPPTQNQQQQPQNQQQAKDALITLALALDGSQTLTPNNNLVYTNIDGIKNPLLVIREELKNEPRFKTVIFEEIAKLGELNKDNIVKANKIIADELTKISSEDFQTIINRIMNKAFAVGDQFNSTYKDKVENAKPNQRKLNYYDKENDLWIINDSKGINVVKRNIFTSLKDYYKYVINDLYYSFNSSDTNRINFNIISELAKLNTEFDNVNYVAKNYLEQTNSQYKNQLASDYILEYFKTKKISETLPPEIANLNTYLATQKNTQDSTRIQPMIDSSRKLIFDSITNNTYVDFLSKSKFNKSDIVTQQQITVEWYKLVLAILGQQLGTK